MSTATVSAAVPLEVSPWQRLLGMYLRWSNRNPGLASILPFVPEQSATHYGAHVVYSVGQLPLVLLSYRALRRTAAEPEVQTRHG